MWREERAGQSKGDCAERVNLSSSLWEGTSLRHQQTGGISLRRYLRRGLLFPEASLMQYLTDHPLLQQEAKTGYQKKQLFVSLASKPRYLLDLRPLGRYAVLGVPDAACRLTFISGHPVASSTNRLQQECRHMVRYGQLGNALPAPKCALLRGRASDEKQGMEDIAV